MSGSAPGDVAERRSPVRLLQVLADTDAGSLVVPPVELHAALADHGAEARTVALAPGRRGVLAAQVPVLAPGRRTLAALTALRDEARWADMLLLRTNRSLPPGLFLLRALPTVLVWCAGGEQPPRALARLGRHGPVAALVEDVAVGDSSPEHVATRRAPATVQDAVDLLLALADAPPR